MPRIARVDVGDQIYHVINRANAAQISVLQMTIIYLRN